MASDGTYTFYLNKENPELAALRKDEVKELTFHVVVRDDKGAYDIKDVTISMRAKPRRRCSEAVRPWAW